MPNSLWPGQTPPGAEKNDPQVAQNAAALRRKIVELEIQQKEAIQRLSTQRISVEEVGMALAKLENELSTARAQLRRVINQK